MKGDNLTEKYVLWAIKMPRSLKERVRTHTSKHEDWTMTAFAKKSVEYLLRTEEPLQDGKGNSSPMLVYVHPDFDKRMKSLAYANYPSVSCLIRTAIITQLVREEQNEKCGRWIPPASQKRLVIDLLHGKIAVI